MFGLRTTRKKTLMELCRQFNQDQIDEVIRRMQSEPSYQQSQ